MNRIAWIACAAWIGLGAGCHTAPGKQLQKAMSATSVDVEKLPTTVEEFVAFRDRVASDEAGGAAALVVALNVYAENEELGLACLTVALDAGRLQDGSAYEGKEPINMVKSTLKSRIAAKPYVARSYFAGTSPEGGYALGAGPYTVEITEVRPNGDSAKVFVACTGADSPRPVTLKRNNRGVWKAHEWSSLEVGVRPPAKNTDDPL